MFCRKNENLLIPEETVLREDDAALLVCYRGWGVAVLKVQIKSLVLLCTFLCILLQSNSVRGKIREAVGPNQCE